MHRSRTLLAKGTISNPQGNYVSIQATPGPDSKELCASIPEIPSQEAGTSTDSPHSSHPAAENPRTSDSDSQACVTDDSTPTESESMIPSFIQGGLEYGVILRDFAYPPSGASVRSSNDMTEEPGFDHSSPDLPPATYIVQGVSNDDEFPTTFTFLGQPSAVEESSSSYDADVQPEKFFDSTSGLRPYRQSLDFNKTYVDHEAQTDIELENIVVHATDAVSVASQEEPTDCFKEALEATHSECEEGSQGSSSDSSWETVLSSREAIHQNDLQDLRDEHADEVKRFEKTTAEGVSRKEFLQRQLKKSKLQGEEKYNVLQRECDNLKNRNTQLLNAHKGQEGNRLQLALLQRECDNLRNRNTQLLNTHKSQEVNRLQLARLQDQNRVLSEKNEALEECLQNEQAEKAEMRNTLAELKIQRDAFFERLRVLQSVTEDDPRLDTIEDPGRLVQIARIQLADANKRLEEVSEAYVKQEETLRKEQQTSQGRIGTLEECLRLRAETVESLSGRIDTYHSYNVEILNRLKGRLYKDDVITALNDYYEIMLVDCANLKHRITDLERNALLGMVRESLSQQQIEGRDLEIARLKKVEEHINSLTNAVKGLEYEEERCAEAHEKAIQQKDVEIQNHKVEIENLTDRISYMGHRGLNFNGEFFLRLNEEEIQGLKTELHQQRSQVEAYKWREKSRGVWGRWDISQSVAESRLQGRLGQAEEELQEWRQGQRTIGDYPVFNTEQALALQAEKVKNQELEEQLEQCIEQARLDKEASEALSQWTQENTAYQNEMGRLLFNISTSQGKSPMPSGSENDFASGITESFIELCKQEIEPVMQVEDSPADDTEDTITTVLSLLPHKEQALKPRPGRIHKADFDNLYNVSEPEDEDSPESDSEDTIVTVLPLSLPKKQVPKPRPGRKHKPDFDDLYDVSDPEDDNDEDEGFGHGVAAHQSAKPNEAQAALLTSKTPFTPDGKPLFYTSDHTFTPSKLGEMEAIIAEICAHIAWTKKRGQHKRLDSGYHSQSVDEAMRTRIRFIFVRVGVEIDGEEPSSSPSQDAQEQGGREAECSGGKEGEDKGEDKDGEDGEEGGAESDGSTTIVIPKRPTQDTTVDPKGEASETRTSQDTSSGEGESSSSIPPSPALFSFSSTQPRIVTSATPVLFPSPPPTFAVPVFSPDPDLLPTTQPAPLAEQYTIVEELRPGTGGASSAREKEEEDNRARYERIFSNEHDAKFISMRERKKVARLTEKYAAREK